jgi:S-adenosylmethionine:tRNA ribosyltransferase-isomerase
MMRVSDFDYELPAELIAQQPLARRDSSRLMIIDRRTQSWADGSFVDFPSCLSPGDVLVLNNTRVFPARMVGKRLPSGGNTELLLLKEIKPNVWQTLARPARRLKTGALLSFGDNELQAEIVESKADGLRVVRFDSSKDVMKVVDRLGQTPLPPYIKRDASAIDNDRERYQTVYAKDRGAIAAPTAGLHFTKDVLNQVKARGVSIVEITLHVGYGTFEPVRVDDVSKHRVAGEYYSIDEEAADIINAARAEGHRIVVVGTTTTRALESATDEIGQTASGAATADLTIVPGYRFKAIDCLLTNFHLPRSSLMILISAFAGRDLVLAAYRHAVNERYRFYSYGDCMLII